MSAGYGNESSELDILLSSSNLNMIQRINQKQSATLSLDFKMHPNTTLKLYALYTHSGGEYESQSKSYNMSSPGTVNYGMSYNHDGKSNMLHSALSGETRLNFLNTVLEYGLAYSITKSDSPNSRSWQYQFWNSAPEGSTTNEMRRLDPKEVIPLFRDDLDSLLNTNLSNMQLKSPY